MGRIYQVVVNGMRGERMYIDLCDTEEQMKSMTVLQLKEKILQRLPDSTVSDDLRLVFTDKSLDKDFTLLCHYGIQHMSVIFMVLKLPREEPLEKGDGGMGDKDKNRRMVFRVAVRVLRGEILIDLCNTEEQFKTFTVLQLKEKILQRLPVSIGSENVRLIFADQLLDEDSTLLCDYGIKHMSVIFMVLKLPREEPLEKGDGGMGDKDKNRRMVFRVAVCGLRVEKIVIDLCDTEEQFKTFTVLQLKEKILQRLPGSIGSENVRLIFADQLLDEDSTLLCDYGIKHMSQIILVLRIPGGGRLPEKGDGGMGDKDKNRSMEKLSDL